MSESNFVEATAALRKLVDRNKRGDHPTLDEIEAPYAVIERELSVAPYPPAHEIALAVVVVFEDNPLLAPFRSPFVGCLRKLPDQLQIEIGRSVAASFEQSLAGLRGWELGPHLANGMVLEVKQQLDRAFWVLMLLHNQMTPHDSKRLLPEIANVLVSAEDVQRCTGAFLVKHKREAPVGILEEWRRSGAGLFEIMTALLSARIIPDLWQDHLESLVRHHNDPVLNELYGVLLDISNRELSYD